MGAPARVHSEDRLPRELEQESAAGTPTLSRGSHGPAVRKLQRLLNARVPNLQALAVDGVFGAVTERQVRRLELGFRADRGSADAARAILDADAGASAAGLGDRVVPGALAGAAHHNQVAVSERESERDGPAAARAERKVARVAQGRGGDHLFCMEYRPGPVTVLCDAVAPVAVEAESGADEGLAELGRVVGAENHCPRHETGRCPSWPLSPQAPPVRWLR